MALIVQNHGFECKLNNMSHQISMRQSTPAALERKFSAIRQMLQRREDMVNDLINNPRTDLNQFSQFQDLSKSFYNS